MCAGVLKNWREAATLILAHCPKNRFPREINPLAVDALKQTPKKDALEVLALKRSSKSSFMPNLYVFPGGTADNADFSHNWLSMFGATSPALAEERFGFSKAVSQNAPMFYRKRDPDFKAIPSEVAFRISAIRETFEESGVLIARNMDDAIFKHNIEATSAFSFGSDHVSQMEEWRQKVMKNPLEFLTLCKNYNIVPDIWSLYDWSNWLSPPGAGNASLAKRFDAAFFICCLKEQPYVADDANELIHSMWVTPRQIMEEYLGNRVQLAPPQLYEASRLMNFKDLDELLRFCHSRVGQPLERWMPVRIQCADAVIYTFPGDSLYPDKPDINGEGPLLRREETLQELMRHCSRLHRAVTIKAPQGLNQDQNTARYQLQCNIPDLPYGQIAPRLK
ncbi:hypothetical protein ACOMHN_011011 [Nucella lapillus]